MPVSRPLVTACASERRKSAVTRLPPHEVGRWAAGAGGACANPPTSPGTHAPPARCAGTSPRFARGGRTSYSSSTPLVVPARHREDERRGGRIGRDHDRRLAPGGLGRGGAGV